jgi:hypothetical protein
VALPKDDCSAIVRLIEYTICGRQSNCLQLFPDMFSEVAGEHAEFLFNG